MAASDFIQKINQRISLSTKAMLLAVVLFSVTLPILNTYYLKAALSGNVEYLQSTADTVQQGAVSLLEKKDITGACELLNSALNKDLLRFFIIQMNGNNICSGPVDLEKEINAPYHVFNQAIDSGAIRFKSAQIGSFIITAGTFNDSWAALWITTKSKVPRMMLGWLLGVVGAFLLVKIVSIPFQRLSQKHQGQRAQKKSLFEVLGGSKEATQAHRASEAFSSERDKLKAQISFIAPDFSKVLIGQMTKQSAEFPFSFAGTILRFDLNGYTKLYFANDKSKIAKIIQAIAIDVDESVSRYEGTHYGFGGDEFIELFEGDKRFIRALYCARAIFSIAQRLDLPAEIASKVKFKAAVASDETMLFSRLPQCYSLVGDSLILTNRYFSAVEDRDMNSLIVGDKEILQLENLASASQLGEHKFKNIEVPVAISKIQDFLVLKDILDSQPDSSKWAYLEFYRTDDDLIELLKELETNSNDETKSQILRHLKKINVTVCPSRLVQTWLEVLRKISSQSPNSDRVISSFINAGKNLIPKNAWHSQLTQAVIAPELRKDSRVVADVVELLSYKLNPSEFNQVVDPLLDQYAMASNRAQGNRLIARCMARLDEAGVKELGSLLKSEQPGIVATGIYCVARVSEHFWKENPVILSQFLEFQDFISRINKLQQSSDKIVSARARIESRVLEGVQLGS